MRSNALWGIFLLILIIAGVAVWALMGEPVFAPSTATSTPQENTGGNTGTTTATTTAAEFFFDDLGGGDDGFCFVAEE